MEATENKGAEEQFTSNTIKTWEALSDCCRQLPLAVKVSSDNISIYKVNNMHVKYSLIIHNDFHITAQTRYTKCCRENTAIKIISWSCIDKSKLFWTIEIGDHLKSIMK